MARGWTRHGTGPLHVPVRLADGDGRRPEGLGAISRATFTLVRKPDAGPDSDEYHLGLFELPTGPSPDNG